MSSTLEIKDNETVSAILGGFADSNFAKAFLEPFKGVIATAGHIAKKLADVVRAGVNLAKSAWNFFVGWFKDDPIGATAGAAAAILTIGVIVVVGGAAVSAIAGGISALGGIGTVASGLLTVGTATGILGSMIRWAVRGVQFLWTFNWNITDTQIREQQEGLLKSLYGQAGQALGSTLGTLLCGSAPVELVKRSKLVKVNPMLLASIKEITEFDPHSDTYGELYEEMMGNLKALVNLGTRAATQAAFLESYKNVRKLIKLAARGAQLDKLFPGFGKVIEKWGEEGSQAWSFASAMEDAVESIEDKNIQAFTEEFLEGFMDQCTESAMIISYVF